MSGSDWAVSGVALLIAGVPLWWLLLRLGPEPFAEVVRAFLESVTRNLEAKSAPPALCLNCRQHLPSAPPPVYMKNSGEFNPDYLAYLRTVETEVGKGPWRVSTKDGVPVRIELWHADTYGYLNFPLV